MTSNRRDSLRRVQPSFDVSDPPEGKRLNLGVVAANLGVTITEMANACTAAGHPISRTGIADVLSNKWPVRTAQEGLRSALLSLMAARGASDDDLATLFWAFGPGKAPGQNPNPTPGSPTAAPAQPEEPDMLLAKQTLTPLAKRHFKLFSNPFDGEVVKDEHFFSGNDIAWVRESAWQCVQNASFVAIVGESGAGKTTILADLEARLLADARGVTLIKPGVLGMEETNTRGQMLKSADILHAVITTLQPTAAVPQTLQARTVRTHKLLASSAEAGNSHLLVIEEAHGLPDATLKHLKRLHELRLGRRPLLGILLLAQPELKTRLANGLRNGALREVAQRCEVVDLLPLDNDLKAYIDCRVQAAGRRLGDLMDDAAIEALRLRLTRKQGSTAVSMCYPLAVNNMLTRALNEAAATGVPLLTKEVFVHL
jgi:type II secretory pathway predicted ATPase ExeA